MKTLEFEGHFLTLFAGRVYHAGAAPFMKPGGGLQDRIWITVWEFRPVPIRVMDILFPNTLTACTFTNWFNAEKLKNGSQEFCGRIW